MTVTTRRTQNERRTQTIAKLVDATIATLLEEGYAHTTVSAICGRAGVSHGGLFRHFESLMDLIMAAADEVAHRQIGAVQARLAQVQAADEPLVAALYALRQATREPINAVLYELVIAARTHPPLRSAMTQFYTRYATSIAAATAEVTIVQSIPAELLPVLLSSLLHLFDGEALLHSVMPMPELEAQRMEVLVGLARLFESITPATK